MKTLPKVDISDELGARINEGIRLSELCKADVVRQALRIGLPQFAARFQPAPLWLEERIREALAEPPFGPYVVCGPAGQLQFQPMSPCSR
jgi:hypothetical protein